MPGDSKFDGRGQRKFIRNMAAGGAIGAAGGNVGAKLATRGRSKLRPIRSGAAGGVLAGGAGVAMVAHQRKKKVHKAQTTPAALSAFGIDHGYEVSKSGTGFKTAVYDPNLKMGKGPKSGTNYSGEERKRARKIVRRSVMAGEGVGAAAGGGPGAAIGAALGRKGGNTKMGAAIGGLGGATIGAATGVNVGRYKGIKRYQKEIGKGL